MLNPIRSFARLLARFVEASRRHGRRATLPRLFFLGAGFSRPAGLPLASELLERTLRELERFQSETHVHWALEEYLDYVEATTGERVRADDVDIEDFIAYLDNQHYFGMLGSDTWSSQGNRPQLLLRWGIGRVLHTATPNPLPSLYLRFAENLRPGDIVVTFNYDLILERALEAVGRPYRRFPSRFREVHGTYAIGDTEVDPTEVLISKLHGSIDWIHRARFQESLDYARATTGAEGEASWRRRDPVFGDNAIVTTRNLVEGPRFAKDPLTDVAVVNELDTYYGTYDLSWRYPPMILAPSQAKQFYGEPFRDLWEGLAGAGSLLSGFSIVGYSLPDADPYTKQVMYEISRSYAYARDHPEARLGPIGRIKLVDRRDEITAPDLLDRYRFLPREHTDFLLDGLDDDILDVLFRQADREGDG